MLSGAVFEAFLQKTAFFLKIFSKKFGGYEKSRTFALPLKNGWLIRLRVLMKDWRRNEKLKNFSKRFGSLKIMRTFAAPFEKRVLERGKRSSLKRLFYCTRSKYRENTIYREALISLEIISVRTS